MAAHLIETTGIGYDIRTYTIGLGAEWDYLTDNEKKIVYDSELYSHRYDIKEQRKIVNKAIADFERLNEIPNMPEEALSIIRAWVEDEEDEDGLD